MAAQTNMHRALFAERALLHSAIDQLFLVRRKSAISEAFHRLRMHSRAAVAQRAEAQAVDSILSELRRPGPKRGHDASQALLDFCRLTKQPMLDRVGGAKLLRIAQSARALHVSRGHVVFSQGSIAERFFLVLSGGAYVYAAAQAAAPTERPEWCDPEAEEHPLLGQRLSRIIPGMGFGELALLSDSRVRNASIVAAKDTLLVTLDRASYLDTLGPYHRDVLKIDQRVEFLRGIEAFRGWTQSRLVQVSYMLTEHKYLRNTVLARFGNSMDGLMLLKRGTVGVWAPHSADPLRSWASSATASALPGARATATGTMFEMKNLGPGAVVGEHALLAAAAAVDAAKASDVSAAAAEGGAARAMRPMLRRRGSLAVGLSGPTESIARSVSFTERGWNSRSADSDAGIASDAAAAVSHDATYVTLTPVVLYRLHRDAFARFLKSLSRRASLNSMERLRVQREGLAAQRSETRDRVTRDQRSKSELRDRLRGRKPLYSASRCDSVPMRLRRLRSNSSDQQPSLPAVMRSVAGEHGVDAAELAHDAAGKMMAHFQHCRLRVEREDLDVFFAESTKPGHGLKEPRAQLRSAMLHRMASTEPSRSSEPRRRRSTTSLLRYAGPVFSAAGRKACLL